MKTCSDMPITLLQSHSFLHAIVHVLHIFSEVQRSSIIRIVTHSIELAFSHILHLAGTSSKMEYMRGCQSNSNRVTGLARRQPCHNRLLTEMQHASKKKKSKTGKTVWQLRLNGVRAVKGVVVPNRGYTRPGVQDRERTCRRSLTSL